MMREKLWTAGKCCSTEGPKFCNVTDMKRQDAFGTTKREKNSAARGLNLHEYLDHTHMFLTICVYSYGLTVRVWSDHMSIILIWLLTGWTIWVFGPYRYFFLNYIINVFIIQKLYLKIHWWLHDNFINFIIQKLHTN